MTLNNTADPTAPPSPASPEAPGHAPADAPPATDPTPTPTPAPAAPSEAPAAPAPASSPETTTATVNATMAKLAADPRTAEIVQFIPGLIQTLGPVYAAMKGINPATMDTTQLPAAEVAEVFQAIYDAWGTATAEQFHAGADWRADSPGDHAAPRDERGNRI